MRQRERQTEGVGGGEEEELLREREEKRLRHVDPPPHPWPALAVPLESVKTGPSLYQAPTHTQES